MNTKLLTSLLFTTSTLVSATLQAQTNTVPSHVQLDVGGDNLDSTWGRLTVQKTTEGGHQLGVNLQGGVVRERFVGGFAVFEGMTLMGNLHGRWLLKEQSRARFHLQTGLGAQLVLADEDTPKGKRAVAITTQIAPSVTVDLSQAVSLQATVPLNFALAISPETELDTLETPMSLGVQYWLSDRLALTSTIFAGGAFGYGGDGAKHRVGASLGLIYTLEARDTTPLQRKASSTGAFVSMDWRGLRLADHYSHGPGFAAGVSWFGGKLKLGIAGFNRPGPLNPKRFNVDLSEGQTYKGKDQLELKSDGSIIGLMIATTLPLTEHLAVDIPLTIGQGAFGFYLPGEDRETPDGRRVSEWEDELFDGRDASFGLGVDVGTRLMWTPPSQPWLRPFVGVHYSTVLGYDSFVTDNYSGPSISLGAEFLVF